MSNHPPIWGRTYASFLISGYSVASTMVTTYDAVVLLVLIYIALTVFGCLNRLTVLLDHYRKNIGGNDEPR